jgi:hypothetical protein
VLDVPVPVIRARIRRSCRGQFGGKRCSARLARASACQWELVSALVRAYAVPIGPDWWPMVRRRSTVRFRKGVAGYGHFSNMEPNTSFG